MILLLYYLADLSSTINSLRLKLPLRETHVEVKTYIIIVLVFKEISDSRSCELVSAYDISVLSYIYLLFS